MRALLYKEDLDQACDRLSRWWAGEDIGRPAMTINAPRREPVEEHPTPLPAPEGACPHYTSRDLDYRVNRALQPKGYYLAESIPAVPADLGANCLALYLGCESVERPETVWFEPCITEPEKASFELDRDNYYWNFTLRLAAELLRAGRGKFLTGFPDLIEGLDTLMGMRGTDKLLLDLLERPEWVKSALAGITERYFECYDTLYDLIKDERGGSFFWAWAPGRLAKLQCDFSAMISPSMFAEFMLPVLREMTERLDYSIYHLDGPDAIVHVDHLISLPRLNMVQWAPGAGNEEQDHPRWWPLYHRLLDGNKSIMIHVADMDNLLVMKREFGEGLKRFMLGFSVEQPAEADKVLRAVSF